MLYLSGKRPADIFRMQKNSLSTAASAIVADKLFHPQPCDRSVVCKGAGAGTFRDLADRVPGAGSVGFPCRGETANAKFAGMSVCEQPPSMCRDIVPCQVSPYTSE